MADNSPPAFPRPASRVSVADRLHICWDQEGMSLRDYFAGQALAGIAFRMEIGSRFSEAVEMAYSFADAMLKERKK